MDKMYRFPMWKVWVFLAICFVGYAALTVFDTAAHPMIAAQLAVNQLDDTESSAIAMRTYDRLQSSGPGSQVFSSLVFGLYLIFGATLFKADIGQLLSRFKRGS